jgi:hypothetical protein
MKDVWSWLSRRGLGECVALGLAAAMLVEGLTILLRFGLGLQASHCTSWVAPYTFGYRIHHGYVGLALLALAVAIRSPGVRRALIVAGVALAVSDAIHHCLVMRSITGSPEFDVRYPATADAPSSP